MTTRQSRRNPARDETTSGPEARARTGEEAQNQDARPSAWRTPLTRPRSSPVFPVTCYTTKCDAETFPIAR